MWKSTRWTCCTNFRLASSRKCWYWTRRRRPKSPAVTADVPSKDAGPALFPSACSGAGTPKTTARTTETCTTAVQTHRMTPLAAPRATTRHRGVPWVARHSQRGWEELLIRWRGDSVLINVNSTRHCSARSWRGRDTPRCACACDSGAAQSKTCGCVSMLTAFHTGECSLSSAKAFVTKDRFPAEDKLALSERMRLAVLPTGSTERIGGCCSAACTPLWQPYVTVSSQDFATRMSSVNNGRQCAPHWMHHQHQISRYALWVHPACHPGLRDPRRSCSALYVHAVPSPVSPSEAWFTIGATPDLDSTTRLPILRHPHTRRRPRRCGKYQGNMPRRHTREITR